MEKAFVSWSGGKDCCQAAYLALQKGYQIDYLVNMVTLDGQLSCSHGLAASWIKLQAQALGLPLIQKPTTGDNYEAVFIDTLAGLKKEGVTAGVFGDIDFLPHLDWIEKICRKAGIVPFVPLWGDDQNKIINNFIELGFVSVVVATRADLLGQEWLGRRIDAGFLRDIAALKKGITACGEAGEFHSLVIDGPLFKKRLEIRETQKAQRKDHWYLEILKCDLVEKC